MKRYILPLAAFVALPLGAQNVVDATRFGSENLTGTARYRAMGGAFGALGGDPTCMTDNPAGMGIYRGTSSISFTPNMSFAHTTVDGSANTKQKKVDFSVSNLAYVLSVPTSSCDHLVNFNFGVGFNHSEGLNRKYKMVLDYPASSFGAYLANRANNALMSEGYYSNPSYLTTDDAWDNTNIPLTVLYGYDSYAIDQVQRTDAAGNTTYSDGVESYDQRQGLESFQRMFVTEQNRNDEYNFNLSGNWDDFIYGGITLTINDFNSTIETEMNEDYDYNYAGDYTQYFNSLETKGTGVGIKAGVLLKPTDTWRIGFAAHTPTWYRMEDLYDGRMITNDPNVSDYSGGKVYSYKYRYYSPWQLQVSSAWVLGGKALLSAEVDMKDFSTQRYRADRDSWDADEFNWMDDVFKDYNKLQMTYKVGGEYRVTDHFSVRAGYAFKGSPYKSELYDHPEASRSWGNGYFGDDNSILFDSSTKPNYSLLGNQQFFSLGVGWSGEWWFIDLTCMDRNMQEKIAAFPTTDAISTIDANGVVTMSDDTNIGAVRASHCNMSTNVLSWDLTLGMRF